eukprot:ctg_754.g457
MFTRWPRLVSLTRLLRSRRLSSRPPERLYFQRRRAGYDPRVDALRRRQYYIVGVLFGGGGAVARDRPRGGATRCREVGVHEVAAGDAAADQPVCGHALPHPNPGAATDRPAVQSTHGERGRLHRTASDGHLLFRSRGDGAHVSAHGPLAAAPDARRASRYPAQVPVHAPGGRRPRDRHQELAARGAHRIRIALWRGTR